MAAFSVASATFWARAHSADCPTDRFSRKGSLHVTGQQPCMHAQVVSCVAVKAYMLQSSRTDVPILVEGNHFFDRVFQDKLPLCVVLADLPCGWQRMALADPQNNSDLLLGSMVPACPQPRFSCHRGRRTHTRYACTPSRRCMLDTCWALIPRLSRALSGWSTSWCLCMVRWPSGVRSMTEVVSMALRNSVVPCSRLILACALLVLVVPPNLIVHGLYSMYNCKDKGC